MYDLIGSKEVFTGLTDKGPLDFQYSDVFDVTSATFENMVSNVNPMAPTINDLRARSQRNDVYKSISGKELLDDVLNAEIFDAPTKQLLKENNQPWRKGEFKPQPVNMDEYTDMYIGHLKTKDPAMYKDLKLSTELEKEAVRIGQEASSNFESVWRGASSTQAFFGGLAGGAAAQFLDPINLISIPIGAGAGASIVKAALTAGAVNIGAEVASHPFIVNWQRKIGNEYGLEDLGPNMAIAGLMGVVLGGGGHLVGKLLKGEKVDVSSFLNSKKLDDAQDMPLSRSLYEIGKHLEDEDPALADHFKSEAERVYFEQETRGDTGWQEHMDKYKADYDDLLVNPTKLYKEEKNPVPQDGSLIDNYLEPEKIDPATNWTQKIEEINSRQFSTEEFGAVEKEVSNFLDTKKDDDVLFHDEQERPVKKKDVIAAQEESKAIDRALKICGVENG